MLNPHADAQLPKEVPQDATYWYRRWLFACDMGDKAATDYIGAATENLDLKRRLRALGQDA